MCAMSGHTSHHRPTDTNFSIWRLYDEPWKRTQSNALVRRKKCSVLSSFHFKMWEFTIFSLIQFSKFGRLTSRLAVVRMWEGKKGNVSISSGFTDSHQFKWKTRLKFMPLNLCSSAFFLRTMENYTHFRHFTCKISYVQSHHHRLNWRA